MSRQVFPWMYLFICHNSSHTALVDESQLIDVPIGDPASGTFKGTTAEALAAGWTSCNNPDALTLSDPPVLWFCPEHVEDIKQYLQTP